MEQHFIGTLATRAGVPIKTIRYYEEVGVLPKPARTASGYRLYPPQIAERLGFIKKAQRLGLRLTEIREILELADRGRCPCGHVQQVLTARLAELKHKISDLRLLQRRIRQAIRRSCPPDVQPQGSAICHTIERQSVRKPRPQ